MLVTLKVPEELYLQAVQWLAEQTQKPADAMLTALTGTNLQLSAVVDELRAKLEAADQENWALRERIKIDAELSESEIQRLRAEIEQTLDGDGSYPDHGEADDRAAAVGEPSLTAGTLVETTRQEAMAQAAETVADEARHEAPEPAPGEPAAAPEGESPDVPEHGAHEAPEPPAPTNEVDAALDMFIEDMVLKAAPDSVVTSADMAAAYDEWRPALGAPHADIRLIGKRLLARGVTAKRGTRRDAVLLGETARRTLYLGVSLKGRPIRTLPASGAVRVRRAGQPGRELPAEMRDLVKEVTTLYPDWVYQRTNGGGRGKPRLITPDGKRVMLPNTPSDHRALANTRARLRRHGAQV